MSPQPSRKKRHVQVYAFVDTNIFLDFYRASNDATLKTLSRLEPVKDRLISTYQVEMEFLKNRQRVLLDSLTQVKSPPSISLPAIFATTATSTSLRTLGKEAGKKASLLRNRIVKLLGSPRQNDVVYQALVGVFQSESEHVLTRDMPERRSIRRKAARRFLLGYPPRKKSDTSIGDAMNWEWIVYCASRFPGKLVIVSRDSDYGVEVNGKYFLNDQLREELRDRAGKKSVKYTHRLTDALHELKVHVPAQELQAETEAMQPLTPATESGTRRIRAEMEEIIRQLLDETQSSE